jgi:predicted RNA-binding protein Jag
MVGFMNKALGLFGIKKEGAGAAGGIGVDDFLTELPQLLGYDIAFKKVDKAEDGLHYEIEGTETDSFLASTQGLLDSLSHLSMRVQRRQLGLANAPGSEEKAEFRIVFDANGFRDRKTTELKKLAEEKRAKVIETGGKPAYIPALGPSERKVIHTHLADLGEVTSESIGRGNFKRIRVKLVEGSAHYREQPVSTEGEGLAEEGGQTRGNGGGRGGRGGRRGGRGGRGRGGANRGDRQPGQGGGFRQRADAPAGVDPFNRAVPEEAFNEVDDNIGNRIDPNDRYND